MKALVVVLWAIGLFNIVMAWPFIGVVAPAEAAATCAFLALAVASMLYLRLPK